MQHQGGDWGVRGRRKLGGSWTAHKYALRLAKTLTSDRSEHVCGKPSTWGWNINLINCGPPIWPLRGWWFIYENRWRFFRTVAPVARYQSPKKQALLVRSKDQFHSHSHTTPSLFYTRCCPFRQSRQELLMYLGKWIIVNFPWYASCAHVNQTISQAVPLGT